MKRTEKNEIINIIIAEANRLLYANPYRDESDNEDEDDDEGKYLFNPSYFSLLFFSLIRLFSSSFFEKE